MTSSDSARNAIQKELLSFGSIYVLLSGLNLILKLKATPPWFDGTLDRNHALLCAFSYTNNEQSRLLQFYIPELFVQVFGLSVIEAYMLQRFVWVAAALILFHYYLKNWFPTATAFAGCTLLAALLPFSYVNDLQESSAFLMVSFLLGLWAIRERKDFYAALSWFVGVLNNETMLCLPALFFFYRIDKTDVRSILRLSIRTVALALPSILVAGLIRYITRHQPHLGGAWHWPDNIDGIFQDLGKSPFEWHTASYIYFLLIFGPLWIYAWFGIKSAGRFIRVSLCLVPLFLFPHFLTGKINEVRQMIPLAFIIIPAALFWLLPPAPDPGGNNSMSEPAKGAA